MTPRMGLSAALDWSTAGLFLLLAACGAPASEAPAAWSPQASPGPPMAPVTPPSPKLTASSAPPAAPTSKPTRTPHPAVLSVVNRSFLFHDEMDRVEVLRSNSARDRE